MAKELIAVVGGSQLGILRPVAQRLEFEYFEGWRAASFRFPLSLSLPLAMARHQGDAVESFLWGLLPDRVDVLRKLVRELGTKLNAFKLVAALGEDLPGAVALVPPERLEALLQGPAMPTYWMDDAEIARRIAALRVDPAAFRRPGDRGRFSLAGAQTKTAFVESPHGRWGIPSGRDATTHIFKLPVAGYSGVLENEYFCLRLASALGFPVARSRVRQFEDERVIVVERYDRAWQDGEVVRFHQEDFCQALAVPPNRKYQAEGGPTPLQMATLLWNHSTQAREDVQLLFEALVFHWLILGTDGHAKNFSLMIGSDGIRLSPLYDLISFLPYSQAPRRKVKLALKIGGEYSAEKLSARHWRRVATDFRLDDEHALSAARQLAGDLLDRLEAVRDESGRDGLDPGVIDGLVGELERWVASCRRRLAD